MEVGAQMRHELGVGRMVRGLDADDPPLERVIVPLQVSEKVQLGHRRAHEQHLTLLLKSPRDLTEEAPLVVGMIPHPQILLVDVTMNVRTPRVHDGLLDLVGVDFEDSRFLLIDPYDGVFHGGLAF